MTKKNKPTPPNRDVEILAIWLHSACRGSEEQFGVLRDMVRVAANNAAEMYESPNPSDKIEPDDDYGVQTIIARFAARLDEMERERLEDQKQQE